METSSEKFKLRLGIFVASGLLILFSIIFFIGKQKNLFDDTFQMKAMFKNIGGVQVGNHVRFSGINIGVIDDIAILSDTSVQITMIVENKIKKFIKKDAIASVGSEGLMGDKLINIGHGTFNSEPVTNNFIIRTSEPIETDEILASLQVTGQNAEIVSNQLAEILLRVNNGNGTLSRLIRDTTIAENLNQTIINLKSGSKNLDQNMEAAKGSILLRGYFKKKQREAEKVKNQKTNSK
jgi:phospholipid/cholesterol/gamma-HCH transport system substrate-binding protein